MLNIWQGRPCGQLYRKRWTIEVFFQSIKGRGFDLEKTHLQAIEKLKKLIAMVSIAYAVCRNMDIYYHKKVQKIKIKKHGCQAKSFFRKGLDILREAFKKPSTELTNFCLECLRTFERWIRIQTSYNQIVIKIFG